jgi:hypothetical protein
MVFDSFINLDYLANVFRGFGVNCELAGVIPGEVPDDKPLIFLHKDGKNGSLALGNMGGLLIELLDAKTFARAVDHAFADFQADSIQLFSYADEAKVWR